eukprot:GHRR01005300.1.p1 GENE.GHRR01005300.1~~GHRR01005300.1.p1  ORF type:complete len:145 (+),score=53.83 GHRR01005300.1:221-655(+)
MTAARVSISVALLEKLGGIKKEAPAKPKQKAPAGLPHLPLGLPVVPPQLAAPFSAPESQYQLRQSKRVGELLLKAEEHEVAAVKQRADELIQQYGTPCRPAPCASEQEACLSCYKENTKDVLKCAQVVAAYSACAQQALSQVFS